MRQLYREPRRERQLAAAGARALADALDELTAIAHARARPGPVELPDDRRLPEEAVEELADAINYVTWGVLAGEIADDTAAVVCHHLGAAYLALIPTLETS